MHAKNTVQQCTINFILLSSKNARKILKWYHNIMLLAFAIITFYILTWVEDTHWINYIFESMHCKWNSNLSSSNEHHTLINHDYITFQYNLHGYTYSAVRNRMQNEWSPYYIFSPPYSWRALVSGPLPLQFASTHTVFLCIPFFRIHSHLM